MSQAEIIEQAIATLQQVQQRPRMWLNRGNSRDVTNFINGLWSGLHCAGVPLDNEMESRYNVQETRGWEPNPAGVAWQMRERGMDEDAIVSELLEIEIETLRLWAEKLKTDGAEGAEKP